MVSKTNLNLFVNLNFVCVVVCDRDGNRKFDSILTKLCTQFLGRNISVEIDK